MCVCMHVCMYIEKIEDFRDSCFDSIEKVFRIHYNLHNLGK